MSKYFTIQELCQSSTAKKLKIDNTPSEDQKKHLEELISVLDQIREALGKPIVVTSGFRSPSLNKAVGGASTSAHQSGWAVDLQVKGMTNKELGCFIRGFLLGKGLSWDQILEESSKSTTWLHFGLKNQQGYQRKQYFSLFV